jgi:hypothetical protein
MTAMSGKVLASSKVAIPSTTAGGYPAMPVAPYEQAMAVPPSQGSGPNRSPGEGTGVYGANSKIGR